MKRVALVMLMCLGCSASAADVWSGEYDADVDHDVWTCSGTAVDASPESAVLVFEQRNGLLVMHGRCPFPLHSVTPTSAEFNDGYSCSRIVDGQEVHVRVVGGSLRLNGTRLTGNLSLEFMTDAECVTDSATIVADRR